ncbi:unnamed protein product, partial [Ceratitis capitata]
ARAELRHSQAPLTAPTLPQPAPSRARTLEAGQAWGGSPSTEQPLGRGSVLSRLGAELELRRCGSSLVLPVQPATPAGSQPLLSRVPGIGLQTWDQSNCPELTDHGLVPLRCGCAREPKRPGEARTAHPPASRRRTAPGKPGLAGAFWAQTEHTLAVELPPQARGTGTLIPSVRRLVWAGSPSLGMQPGALPFPRKELSPREALAVCTPPAPKPSARTPGS